MSRLLLPRMRRLLLPRSAWNARPSRGRTFLDPGQVDGVAVHWPGTTSTRPLTRAAVPRYLSSVQAFHMDGKGWSDIAYQAAVDQYGRAWELRGLGVRSAANGDTNVNSRFGAVLLLLVMGEEPTEAMLSTTADVVAAFRRRFPDGRQLVGHRQVRPEPTLCPGPAAMAALPRMDPDNRNEDDMPLSDDDVRRVAARVNAALGDYGADGEPNAGGDDPERAAARLRQLENTTRRIEAKLDRLLSSDS